MSDSGRPVFHLALLKLDSVRSDGSALTHATRFASAANPNVSLQRAQHLWRTGHLDDLAVALPELAGHCIEDTPDWQEEERVAMRRLWRWYREKWQKAEAHWNWPSYASAEGRERELLILMMARGRHLSALAADLRANWHTYYALSRVHRSVLSYALRLVLQSPHRSRFALHQFYKVMTRGEDMAEVLREYLASWDLVRGNLVLECLLQMAAAIRGEADIQRLARSYTGLDLQLFAEPKGDDDGSLGPEPRVDGNPRVAVCVSGMLRDADAGARSIRQHLVEPLGADVFVDTWDVEQTWFGMGGGNSVKRTVGANLFAMLPSELHPLERFREFFPSVAELWEKPRTTPLGRTRLDRLYGAIGTRIESDDSFIEGIRHLDAMSFCDSFNQARMFYKMWRASRLMADYERDEGVRYDYVIRIRPDFILRESITWAKLRALASDEVVVDEVYPHGPSDMFAYGRRAAMDTYAGLWPVMRASERLSPFPGHPGIRSHRLLFLWLYRNHIRVRWHRLDASLSPGDSVPFPDTAAALEKDLRGPAASLREESWVDEFFGAVKRRGVEPTT